MDTIRNRVGEVYEPFKVRFLEREIHALADDEVLVRVRASAICGSDLHIARGLHPSAPLPVTIGHEFSGDVTAVGSGVDNVRVGQRVTVEPCIVCGKCDAAATETTATVSISASPTATAMERWRIMWWQKLLMFMSCPNISLTRQGR